MHRFLLYFMILLYVVSEHTLFSIKKSDVVISVFLLDFSSKQKIKPMVFP